MRKANSSQDRMLTRTVLCAAWYAIALGALMVVLWLSRSRFPELAMPGFFHMKLNTSLAFIGAGAGLIAAKRRSRPYTLLAGSVVLTIGGITLAQYLVGLNFGFDELLLRDSHYPASAHPGRMAPAASLAFACTGLVLLLAADDARRRGLGMALMELLSFFVFALGAVGAIGHLLSIELAESWGSAGRMAPQASAGFPVLGIGLMALTWHREQIAVARIPLWVPAFLCFTVLAVDATVPRGIATGVGYIPLVFCSLWFARPHVAFVFAALASILAVLGFFAKPPGDIDAWTAAVNRAVALAAIWLVAIVVHLTRRTEMALEQSRIRQSAIFNFAVDGVISINHRGLIEEFNPACERMFGYTAQEVRGQNVKMLMPEPYHSEHDGYLARYLATGRGQIIGTSGREVAGRRKDGSIFPIDLSVTVFELADGQHFSGVVRDITDRKAADSERLLYTAALERSNKELDDFAYIASHDLKEPLRGLHNNARFLQEDNIGKFDEASEKRLVRIGFLSQRLERLIDDLLYFSRLGRQEMAVQLTDLNKEIHDIASLMEETLKEQNARIVMPYALPLVACNRPRIVEVFRNLITNAVKYNDKLEKIVEIGCLHDVKTGWGIETQVFYVKDNGIGIEEQFFDAVFRMFKRLNQEDDSKRGTGVGLTFVRKIIQRHGGRIWLESTPGQGTTFYFTLSQETAYAAA